jgi:hypothetical protein
MDIRTGRTYPTREAALKAGVPPSDLAHVTRRDGDYWPKFDNSKYKSPHQGQREMARRAKRQAATIKL